LSRRSRKKREARRSRAERRSEAKDLVALAGFDLWEERYEAALTKARQALLRRPGDREALEILLRSAVHLNDLDALAEHAGRLLDLEVEPGLALELNVGVALHRARRFEEARGALEAFLERGGSVHAWRQKAERLLRSIDFVLAEREAGCGPGLRAGGPPLPRAPRQEGPRPRPAVAGRAVAR
jgi:hypothetical protein